MVRPHSPPTETHARSRQNPKAKPPHKSPLRQRLQPIPGPSNQSRTRSRYPRFAVMVCASTAIYDDSCERMQRLGYRPRPPLPIRPLKPTLSVPCDSFARVSLPTVSVRVQGLACARASLASGTTQLWPRRPGARSRIRVSNAQAALPAVKPSESNGLTVTIQERIQMSARARSSASSLAERSLLSSAWASAAQKPARGCPTGAFATRLTARRSALSSGP